MDWIESFYSVKRKTGVLYRTLLMDLACPIYAHARSFVAYLFGQPLVSCFSIPSSTATSSNFAPY